MKSKNVALGQAMWTELAPTFVAVADANHARPADVRERAHLWAGFMAAAIGSMSADLGFEIASVVIDGAMNAAADAAANNGMH